MADFGSKQTDTQAQPPARRGRPKGSGGGAVVAAGAVVLPGGVVQISEPKCKICMSPHRAEIDRLLSTGGWSQAAIIRHFNQLIVEESARFNAQNISNHTKKHLTSTDAAVRRIMEERARQVGLDIDAAENFIVTHRAVLDTIVHEGLIALRSGLAVAEPDQIIKAIQLLDKMEAEWKDTAVDEMLNEFRFFTEAVKEVVGEELYEQIYDKFVSKVDKSDRPGLTPLPSGVSEAKVEQAEAVLAEEEIEDVGEGEIVE